MPANACSLVWRGTLCGIWLCCGLRRFGMEVQWLRGVWLAHPRPCDKGLDVILWSCVILGATEAAQAAMVCEAIRFRKTNEFLGRRDCTRASARTHSTFASQSPGWNEQKRNIEDDHGGRRDGVEMFCVGCWVSGLGIGFWLRGVQP